MIIIKKEKISRRYRNKKKWKGGVNGERMQERRKGRR